MKLEFIVLGPPVPLERARVETRFLPNGKRITKGRTPARSSSYRDRVQWSANSAMNAQRWKTTLTARYALTLRVFWSDDRARDLSNVLKAIEDAMNGGVFRDDSQIDELLVYGAVDRVTPRVEVELREIERRLGSG